MLSNHIYTDSIQEVIATSERILHITGPKNISSQVVPEEYLNLNLPDFQPISGSLMQAGVDSVSAEHISSVYSHSVLELRAVYRRCYANALPSCASHPNMSSLILELRETCIQLFLQTVTSWKEQILYSTRSRLSDMARKLLEQPTWNSSGKRTFDTVRYDSVPNHQRTNR